MTFGLSAAAAAAIVAGVLAAAAGTVGTISAYRQGRAQEKMYQAEADMAYKQAAEAEKRSQKQQELIQDKAMAESKQLRREQLKMLSRQKAAMAAMGISGVTAEDIIADTTKIQEEDKSTLRWNADTATWETKVAGDYESWQFRTKGVLARSAAKNTHNQTNFMLARNILDTASSTVSAFRGGSSSSRISSTPQLAKPQTNVQATSFGGGMSTRIKAVGGTRFGS